MNMEVWALNLPLDKPEILILSTCFIIIIIPVSIVLGTFVVAKKTLIDSCMMVLQQVKAISK